MVWGCFTYDKKGPLHVWEPETTAIRKKAKIEVKALNYELEHCCKEEWELNLAMNRLHLRPNRGRTPK
jgi:hypothetical protein